MGVDNSSLLDQQVASGVGNLLTRSVMYQILSACFLYPEEKNLSILKSPDFQEHVKDLMPCYEGNDDGVELKRCLKEVQELFKGTTIETLQRGISVYCRTHHVERVPFVRNPIWRSSRISASA